MFLTIIAALPLAIWTYLLAARAGYWRTRKHLLPPMSSDAHLPTVVAVVPARNEADVIGECLRSLLPVQTVLVDDGSTDGTAEAALTSAAQINAQDRPLSTSSSSYTRRTGLRTLPVGWQPLLEAAC